MTNNSSPAKYGNVPKKLLFMGTYYYQLVRAGLRVIKNEGWRSFFRKVGIWLRLRRATARKRFCAPKFKVSISRKEAEKLVFPTPSGKPDVSIVIPVYNKWKYTLNCLKSICENTGGDYEVVVIDDASTDATATILSNVRNLNLVTSEQNMGFVGSCNRGARASKGNYILFLNNDTMVTKGWLPPLLEIIEKEDVGAVGSKLVYPDGTLQEAGGLIWNDGTGWNYGRGDGYEKPEYNYVRQVDYCSGACLLVKRELFEKIGGFDERFKPAYCEDTDLCFSLRSLGYKVLYQPMSAVVHFEGVTCGTNISRGIKKYQEINRQKFVEKWSTVLQKYHYPPVDENVFLARDRVPGRRMLVIDHFVPTYDQDAGSESTFNILKLLSELGHKVTFIGDNLLSIQPYTTALQQNGIEVIYGPYVLSVEEYIKRHGRYFDVVILSRPQIAIKHIESVKRNCDRAKIIYDTKDLVYIRESRRAEVENSEKVRKLAEASKRTEFYLAENTDLTLVVSPEEKKILLKENPRLNVEVLRHVLPVIKQPKKPFSERKDLLYVGGFYHIPNVDGVIYFVNEIFPGIRKRLPGVRLYIVGSNPPHEVSSLQSSDIIVTGFVKDMAPYFENCRVFVVPLRYGAGIKGKVVHSMIRGLPVVATPIGAEGIIEEVEEGKDILVANTKEEFVEKVVSLYTDEKLWNILSESPLHYVEKNYSYEASRIRLKEILEKLCGAK
jgi:GT2 family glycosyltransferase